MHTVKPKDRDPAKEYPSQDRPSTPVRFRGENLEQQQMREFMQEWSNQQAEANHVETIEEANDFDIGPMEEDEDFFHQLTVYEMHEAAEENLALQQELAAQAGPEAATASVEPAAETSQPGESDKTDFPLSPPPAAEGGPATATDAADPRRS